MTRARLVVAVAVVGALAACTVDPYDCHGDSRRCLLGQQQGSCRPGGDGHTYCSFSDDGCPSGWRWDGSAPSALAHGCVAGLDGGTVDLEGVDLASGCDHSSGACDPLCQDCASGMKCVLDGSGRSSCVMAGTLPVGARCGQSGVDDCAAGAVCALESKELMIDLCRRYCAQDSDCPSGARCEIALPGSTLRLCTDPVTDCGAVTQTGCTMGACYPVTSDGSTGCHAAGTGTQGAGCDSSYVCAPGYACIGMPSGKCYPLCTRGGANTCPSSLQCFAQTGWTRLGVCD